MIPNLLNTILGIALVYCAILAPEANKAGIWPMLGAGLGIVALALWARAGEKLKWFNLVNAIAGVALILLGLVASGTELHPLVTFWWLFWVGTTVGVLALWSAIYNREISGQP
jgi:hypothetical protein